MSEQIFREKTLKQFSTPEQLTDYLRVTAPGVWFVLTGIIVLLAGALGWSIFGQIISTVEAPAQIKDGQVICYLLQEDMNQDVDTVEIQIGDVEILVDTAAAERKYLDASEDQRFYASGYLSPGKNVTVLKAKTDLKDGIYDATVVTEAFHPISLLFSKE